MQSTFRQLGCVVALFLAGCSNPATDKPEAVVSEAVPVEASTAPASSEVLVETGGEPVVVTAANRLVIQPETSTIGFVGSKVTGSHDGGFKVFTGTIDLTPAYDGVQAIKAEIDMNSTWSDNDNLTQHLKTQDFFDVAAYPTSTFETTEIATGGDDGATHTITGNLTLHGVTKSITFPATVTVTDTEAALDSEFFIRRKDFGIAYEGRGDDLIRDEVVLKLAIRADRP